MQYGQLRSSWLVDEPSYDPFLQNQIKLEREDETDADPIEEDKKPWTEDEIESWLAVRRREGLKIDPKTAKVRSQRGFVHKPYGVYRDLSEDEQMVGSMYFARRPGSHIWVWFRDLPEVTRGKLWQRLYGRMDT